MTAPIFHRNIEQGSPEWFALHVGRVTAGSFHRFMTSDFEPRKGEMFKSFVAEKVAEKWRGQLQQTGSSFAMEQGLILEEEVIPWYELEYDVELRRVGFIESPDGRCGCSPDGMVADNWGLELKCPLGKTHVGYLLAGTVPADYVAQVHGSMFVTGAVRWDFVSYRRGFPQLVVMVDRDEAIMHRIGETLAYFYEHFDAALARIKAISETKP